MGVIGSVKIDTHRKERQYAQQFPLHTPDGVQVFLENLHYVRSRRLKGDIDASLLLIDFEKSVAIASLSHREKEVINYRYEREFTEIETAKHLGLSVRAVKKYCHRAVRKIANTIAIQEGR